MRQFYLCLSIVLTSLSLSGQNRMMDSSHLVTIYNTCDGANWDADNWLNGPISDWEGVTLRNGRVTELSFQRFGLKDTIPNVIHLFDALKIMNISELTVTAIWDLQQATWTDLEEFSLNFGKHYGNVEGFCRFPNISAINLGGTQFTGYLPECLKSAPLKRIFIANANLSDTIIPAWTGELKDLFVLALEGMNLRGPIPQTLCNSNAFAFYFRNNNLSGAIPPCLNSSNHLGQLFLANNNFEGDFPIEVIGSKMSILEIDENNFTGDVSTWDWTPTALGAFEMGGNQFTGVLDLGKLSPDRITRIGMQNNQLDGFINFESYPRMSRFEVEGNRFNFDDLELVDSIPSRFTYAPQDSLGEEKMITFVPGSDFTLECPAGGTITNYQWSKDGSEIPGATSSELMITDAQSADMGTYTCAATHDSFPDLTLHLRPITIGSTTSSTDFTNLGWYAYPVPAFDVLNVTSATSWTAPVVQLVTSSGQVFTPTFRLSGNQIQIDVSGLNTGVYAINVSEDEQRGSHVFVK